MNAVERLRLSTCWAETKDCIHRKENAAPGTEVSVVWGDHPGSGTAPEADLGFPRIRATGQPAPYNEFARTNYRAHSAG